MPTIRSLPLLALLGAAALPAQTIRYVPGEYKYSVATVLKQSQSLGAQQQASTIHVDQRMAVLLIARGSDSLRFRTTLEDYTISADLPIQLPDVGKLKGTVIDGVMTSYGRVSRYTQRAAPAAAGEVATLAENMSRFILALSPQAEPGYSWSDTATNKSKTESGELSERTITTTVIDGDTVVAGVKAWRVRRHTVVTVTGTQVQGGAVFPFSSDADGVGTYLVSLKGVYLGARTTNKSVSTIQLPTGGTEQLTSQSDVAIALLK